MFTAIKPYTQQDVNTYCKLDSNTLYKNKLPWFFKEDKKNYIRAYPLFAVQPGYDLQNNKSTLETSIGASLNGAFSDKLAFSVNGIAGAASFPGYLDSTIQTIHVIPGYGYAYKNGSGYSWQYFSGYLSYSPNHIFNFQVGQDKQFWGDGYRSLLLSDAANAYPFLKISTTIWKIKYVNLFTVMKDVTTPTGLKSNFSNKYGTFHYLSWNVCKRLNMALFESIIWQGSDSTRHRTYDVNYLNPVIFYRPVEYAMGSSDNALIGFSFRLKVAKKQQFYGQLIIDEFLLKEIRAHNDWWANKQGFQLGFKDFDLLKINNLDFQTEFNFVRPYTYSHGSVQQNYGHYNQPLADPMGANFMESVSFLTYRYHNFLFEGKAQAAVYGADTAGIDYGRNIFLSYDLHPNDYGNYTGQGLKTTLITGGIRLAYVLSPQMNLKIESGFDERITHVIGNTSSSPFIYLGIRTSLGNFYDDF